MQRDGELAIVLLLLYACVSHAQAPEQPRYTLKQSEPTTGTAIRRTLVASTFPLDKAYHELTDGQRASLRSQYVDMKPEDEPPFPLDGLGKLFDNIRKVTERLHGQGHFSLLVRISSTGEANSAEVLQAPDEELGRFAATVAMLTKYKPAVCSGQPCTMDFPIRLDVTRR